MVLICAEIGAVEEVHLSAEHGRRTFADYRLHSYLHPEEHGRCL